MPWYIHAPHGPSHQHCAPGRRLAHRPATRADVARNRNRAAGSAHVAAADVSRQSRRRDRGHRGAAGPGVVGRRRHAGLGVPGDHRAAPPARRRRETADVHRHGPAPGLSAHRAGAGGRRRAGAGRAAAGAGAGATRTRPGGSRCGARPSRWRSPVSFSGDSARARTRNPWPCCPSSISRARRWTRSISPTGSPRSSSIA